MKIVNYTEEQNEEIRSLLDDGLSPSDIIELLNPKYNRPLEGLRAKIYAIIKTFPPERRDKMDMRHKNKGTPKRKPALMAVTPSVSSTPQKPEIPPEKPQKDLKAAIASKIEIVECKVRKTDLVFPVVARHFVNRHIVLFTSLHRGVVLHAGNSNLYAGYVNEALIPCTDSLQWEILDEVTLTFKS